MVESCLTGAKRGMKRAVLEVVASKAVASAEDVKRYIQCTLLATTTNFEVWSLFMPVMILIFKRFAKRQPQPGHLAALYP